MTMESTDITISDAERESKQLSAKNVGQAQGALKEQGYAILRGAVPVHALETLKFKMEEDLKRLLAMESQVTLPYNWVKGHLAVQPPPEHPYLFPEILANPFAAAVSKAVHSKFFNNAYDGLTILPGTSAQPLHADHGQLWPDLKEAHPPVTLVINIPLTDTNEQNGAIELWPGTHLNTTIWKGDDIEVPAAAIESLRQPCTPIRACTRQGDILMRDMRLWHRGMPNFSESPRIMLVNTHHIFWRERNAPIKIPLSAKAFFDALEVDTVFEVQSEGFDYLIQHEPYAYTPS